MSLEADNPGFFEPDDHVCLCYRVSLRKIVNYLNRERPTVPSLLSECLGAGTGCHWCVPFLKQLHEQWERGEEPTVTDSPESYAHRRSDFHKTGRRSLES